MEDNLSKVTECVETITISGSSQIENSWGLANDTGKALCAYLILSLSPGHPTRVIYRQDSKRDGLLVSYQITIHML